MEIWSGVIDYVSPVHKGEVQIEQVMDELLSLRKEWFLSKGVDKAPVTSLPQMKGTQNLTTKEVKRHDEGTKTASMNVVQFFVSKVVMKTATEKKYRKFMRDPKTYFMDSQNFFVRQLAKFYP